MRCRGQPKTGACSAIADSLRKVSGNGNHEAVKMRPKLLHWDQQNMGWLPRRTVVLGSYLNRKAKWAAIDKAQVKDRTRPLELIYYHGSYMLYMQQQDLIFALLGFGLASEPSFLAILFHSSRRGMFILCHFILEVNNFFYFREFITKRLSFRRNTELWNSE